MNNEPKPGWKTTEFWLTLVAVTLGATMAAGLIPVESEWGKIAGVVAAVLATYGYTAGRSKVKAD